MGGTGAYRRPNLVKQQMDLDNLYKCVNFCLNEVDCRRVLISNYFGDEFDAAECNRTCDNCLRDEAVEELNVSDLSQDIVKFVEKYLMEGNKQLTMNKLMQCVKGEKGCSREWYKAFTDKGIGRGAQFTKSQLERLGQQMLIQGFLSEDREESNTAKGFKTSNGFTLLHDYVKIGPNYRKLLSGEKEMILRYRESTKAYNERNAREKKKRKAELAKEKRQQLQREKEEIRAKKQSSKVSKSKAASKTEKKNT